LDCVTASDAESVDAFPVSVSAADCVSSFDSVAGWVRVASEGDTDFVDVFFVGVSAALTVGLGGECDKDAVGVSVSVSVKGMQSRRGSARSGQTLQSGPVHSLRQWQMHVPSDSFRVEEPA
jgi:hypothetical protein